MFFSVVIASSSRRWLRWLRCSLSGCHAGGPSVVYRHAFPACHALLLTTPPLGTGNTRLINAARLCIAHAASYLDSGYYRQHHLRIAIIHLCAVAGPP